MPDRFRTLLTWTLVVASLAPAPALARVVWRAVDELACGGDRCCCVEVDGPARERRVRFEAGCSCGAPHEGSHVVAPPAVPLGPPDGAGELLGPQIPDGPATPDAPAVPESWSHAPDPPPPRG